MEMNEQKKRKGGGMAALIYYKVSILLICHQLIIS
jgi:hypothetical protein